MHKQDEISMKTNEQMYDNGALSSAKLSRDTHQGVDDGDDGDDDADVSEDKFVAPTVSKLAL